jgi:hypothetical protein
MPEEIVDPGPDANAVHALIPPPRNAVETRDVREVQLSGAHPLADEAQGGMRAQCMTDPDSAATGSSNLGDVLRVGPAQRDGNLNDHILACLERLHGLFAVQRTRRGDQRELDVRISEGRFDSRRSVRELPAAGELVGGLLGTRNDPPRQHATQLSECLHVPFGDRAGADHAQPDGLGHRCYSPSG